MSTQIWGTGDLPGRAPRVRIGVSGPRGPSRAPPGGLPFLASPFLPLFWQRHYQVPYQVETRASLNK